MICGKLVAIYKLLNVIACKLLYYIALWGKFLENQCCTRQTCAREANKWQVSKHYYFNW